jgi:hypothetical protein
MTIWCTSTGNDRYLTDFCTERLRSWGDTRCGLSQRGRLDILKWREIWMNVYSRSGVWEFSFPFSYDTANFTVTWCLVAEGLVFYVFVYETRISVLRYRIIYCNSKSLLFQRFYNIELSTTMLRICISPMRQNLIVSCINKRFIWNTCITFQGTNNELPEDDMILSKHLGEWQF